MGVFDPTKPIYTGHENVEEFLIYFEAYVNANEEGRLVTKEAGEILVIQEVRKEKVSDVRCADIKFFEVMEKVLKKDNEYLLIHINEDEKLFDIRTLGKRWRPNIDEEKIISKRRKSKESIEFISLINKKAPTKESVMYILMTELSQEIDILKLIAEKEITITLGQLFKWSPKARNEVLKKNELKLDDILMSTPKINSETVSVSVDLRSYLNLMHERYVRKYSFVWQPANKRGCIADNQLNKFVECITNIEVDIKGIVVYQEFYILEAVRFDILLDEGKAVFIASIVPNNWISENKEYSESEEEDVEGSNVDNLVVREISGIDIDHMIDQKYEERVVCWLKKDENEDRTIKGMELELIIQLTKENCSMVNIGNSLSEIEEQQLQERLIKKILNVFAFDLSEIRKTDPVQYEVHTGRKMIPLTLLEKGTGQYAYHCFPVRKKEGDTDHFQIVSDMRPLNKYIIKDNAFKRYWQICIQEKDRNKVAISILLGTLQYAVMCMGLKNANETFQCLMDIILEGEEWKEVAGAYQDDIRL
ncbi:1147_t:CDS:2 [Scutellospora calospora]|uniref:1147_t:CDS:1 n=1 Tax=Scutellospora calospora TaxID=85575 RepID=A0ACA9KK76_9GLOM|nr:1147_t:CDS:2 [Scutellospora calospora]